MEILFLLIFGLIISLISIYGYKISARTAEDYLLASRRIGIFVMFFFILFSISSAWTFYAYPGYLYLHGPGFVYFIWGCIAGCAILYMFIGPRLWAIAKLNRFLSPLEIISERYQSPFLKFLVALLLLSFIIPYIGIQPLGVGLGFNALTGLSIEFGALYCVVLLILIVLLGGMRIVAWVNIFLGVIYTSAFLGSLIWICRKLLPEGLSSAAEKLMEINPALLSTPGPFEEFVPITLIGLLIAGLLAFSWPHVLIGTLTARDKSIFKWFPLLTLIFAGVGFYTIPFIFGSLVAPAVMPGLKEKAADMIVQTIITKYLPRWFSVFVLMGVIAAAVSTAAIQLMTASIIISKDLIHGFFKPKAAGKEIVLWTRLSVIAIIILSLGVAIHYKQALVLYLTHFAVPGFAQWAPALAGGIFWKRGTKQGAISGTFGGTVYLIIGFIFPSILLGWHPVVMPLLLNIILYVLISYLTPPPSEEIQYRFFEEVDDFLQSG